MDKLTKSAIATGAAAVLLIGGWGTYAYWTGTTDQSVGSIQSGDLVVNTTNSSCGTWTYSAGTDSGTAASVLVPGDQASATCSVTFTGNGDHLWVNVSADGGSGSTATPLPDGLTITPATFTEADVATNDGSTPTVDASGNIEVSTGTTYTVTVDVVADWAYGASPGTTAPTSIATYTLADVSITVTQAQTSFNPQTS